MSTRFHPTPIPWSQFPVECLFYFIPMSVLHLAAFLVGCGIVAVLPHKQPGTVRRSIGHLALFVGLLLLVGSVFNGLWSCLIWERLYDSTDYVFDFMPFWPISRAVIDAPWGDARGRLIGVSLFQLQLIWLLFAAGTWGATAFCYRLVRKQGRLTKMRGRQRARLKGVESGRAQSGRAAYLVGWTEPLRRACGVIGEVGGSGAIAPKRSHGLGGTLPGFEGAPVAAAEPEWGRRGLLESPAADRGKSWT